MTDGTIARALMALECDLADLRASKEADIRLLAECASTHLDDVRNRLTELPTWGGIQYLLPEDECRHSSGSWRPRPGVRPRCMTCGRIEVTP